QDDPGKKPRAIWRGTTQQSPQFASVFNVWYRFHPFISIGHKFPTLGSRRGKVKSRTYPDRGARLWLHSPSSESPAATLLQAPPSGAVPPCIPPLPSDN